MLFLFTSSSSEVTSFYIKSGWMDALHIWESGRFFFVSMSMDPLNRRWHQFQYFMKRIMLFVMFLHRFIHFNLFVYLFTNQAKLKSVTQIWVLLRNNPHVSHDATVHFCSILFILIIFLIISLFISLALHTLNRFASQFYSQMPHTSFQNCPDSAGCYMMSSQQAVPLYTSNMFIS